MSNDADNRKDEHFEYTKKRFEDMEARIRNSDRSLGHLDYLEAKRFYENELRLKKARDRARFVRMDLRAAALSTRQARENEIFDATKAQA